MIAVTRSGCQEAAAEEFEEAINLDKGTPEAMGCGGVIGGVGPGLREADRVRDLVRHLVDRQYYADAVQEFDNCVIKIGDSLRLEPKRPFVASTGADDQPVTDKIELDLEDFVVDRDRRGAESRAAT
jgi:hypothetical protein